MSPVVGDCCARPAADTNANDIAAKKEINRIDILLLKAAILRPLCVINLLVIMSRMIGLASAGGTSKAGAACHNCSFLIFAQLLVDLA